MEFEKRKAATLSSLGSSETDKSPKGTLDTPIIPLLNTLNAHPSYFTTSSCSGRISILSQPSTNTFPRPNNNNNNNKNKKKARGGSWLLITHDPANPDSVVSLLFPSAVGEPSALAAGNELVFRFEPLILAVDCKDIESAQSLVSLAISSGFRESGITSAGKKRVIVGIRCSIRMEVPLGDGGGDILVSPDYVRFLVGVANQKMEANRKRTEGFLSALRENGFVGPTVVENNVDGGFDDGGDDDDGDAGDDILERTDGHGHRVDHNGLLVPGCSLSISQMIIVGEPVEKLFRWGHSSCTLNLANRNEILVFGGFGGIGRHARRNDSLLLDPLTGALKAIDLEGAPMPRLGHTASLVGGFMFIIGGRADPLNILGDVWVLDTTSFEWRLLECTGSLFPPRHRHAATVDGSNIYVFGGLNNNTIFSSLHVLSTECMHWKEVLVGGEQPCARHSHAMVVYRSKLFVFGGYNGEKALGDLYSFDIQTLNWKQEKPLGRSPHARFSHSMFVYNNFIGVIGGCPVRKHSQGLALLDMQLNMWKHVMLDFIGRELFVRSTANIVGDDLIMLGGGAACYAFGTKFSEPLKTNLLPFMPLEGKIKGFEVGAESVTVQCDGMEGEKDICNQDLHVGNAETSIQGFDLTFESGKHQLDASHWVIQIERIYAKLGKDILKRLGWLDLGRKAYGEKDGLHICFPITEKLSSALIKKQHQYGDAFVGHDDALTSNSLVEGNLPNEFSCLTAFSLLKECGATVLPDEATQLRKTVKSPLQIMNESVGSLIGRKGLSEKLLDQIPTRWERLGDIVVLPVTSFKDPAWDLLGEELWPTIARSLNAHRLARQGRVASTGTRDSNLEILVGDNGWVEHRENGILYSFDATKCMFSWGNLSEKLRMARLHCEDEVVVDLFAGIGYFVLPFLVRAKAKLVYACEWNPYAVEALKQNLRANSVSDRCIVLEGDNRLTAPKGVASRVCLGLLPTSEGSWVTAVRALRKEGGVLHVHGNVEDTKESVWSEHVIRSFDQIARSEGHCWEVSLEHVERVKWYAPHVRHLVADVRCRHIQR